MHGGHDGSRNYMKILRADGSETVLGKVTGLPLRRGDVVRMVTATGGGWGDPRRRDPARVRDDVRAGYITAAQARQHYGVEC
jgi:N-methylhydantoinase B